VTDAYRRMHRQTPESKFTKFGEEMSIGKTLNHAEFCGDLTRNVRDISDEKCVHPKKVGQNSPKKSIKTCYPLKSPIMYNVIKIGETTTGPNVTDLLLGHITPPLATCKISSRFDDPSPRYLLSNFVDFVAFVTHKKHKNITVNDVTALHAATIKRAKPVHYRIMNPFVRPFTLCTLKAMTPFTLRIDTRTR